VSVDAEEKRLNRQGAKVAKGRGGGDFGFWILDFGFWILDFGFWMSPDFYISAFSRLATAWEDVEQAGGGYYGF
jgi:hypothetical protein